MTQQETWKSGLGKFIQGKLQSRVPSSSLKGPEQMTKLDPVSESLFCFPSPLISDNFMYVWNSAFSYSYPSTVGDKIYDLTASLKYVSVSVQLILVAIFHLATYLL